MSGEYRPHINEQKKREVERLKKLFQEYPVVGIADLEHLPAANLQKIKRSLRGKAEFVLIKRRFIIIAINEIKDKLQNADGLLEKMKGMVALLFSKEDPFQLYKVVQKNISPAPARGGQESPEDITIPAGPTAFMAGPMIGELGQLGLKTEVKEGKIAIKEDKVVVKQGQIISAKVAELLTKFGIEPMKVGLNVLYTYQKGEILGKEILGVSEEEYIGFVQTGHREALNLAVFIAYPSKETIGLLIQKAARESKGLSDMVKLDEGQPAAEKKEEPAREEPKETPAPQPDPAPVPKEEPKQEEVKPEPTPEIPKEQSQQEQKKEAASPAEEKPAPETHPKKSDEQVAQEVLKRLQDEKMRARPQPARQVSASVQEQEKDLSKLINKLKDQKNPGKK